MKNFSVDAIKAMTALRRLQMILHMDLPNLILEWDPLVIVEAIKSQDLFSLQGHIIIKIQRLLKCFQRYEAAHLLAQHSKRIEDTAQWRH